MFYEDEDKIQAIIYEDEDKIQAIKNWADDDRHSWFDTTFVEAMEDALEEHGELTERQSAALDSIIEGNKINVAGWLDE